MKSDLPDITIEAGVLVAIYMDHDDEAHAEEMLDELAELVDTCGGQVAARMSLYCRQPKPRYILGSGKVDEVVRRCRELQADTIILDNTLTAAQQRNWESRTKLRVVDRQEIILNIFAHRASTREAELQIELARSEYMLPRLKRAWTHLHRQRGGVGVRGGEGEKQIEMDARMVRQRITRLKRELKDVRKQRHEQRKKRRTVPVPNAAIVGYTNAGKSMLLRQLTEAAVLVEDKLFATLDATTRQITLSNNQDLLVTDTVGFVRNLPHSLIEAFKATLEEAVLADFLIQVVDVNTQHPEEFIKTTEQVLDEIGAGDKKTITAFNKIDVADEQVVRRMRRERPDAVFISARNGTGLDELLARAAEIIDQRLTPMQLRLPLDRHDVLAALHRSANVLEKEYEHDGIHVLAHVPDKFQSRFEPFLQQN